MALEAKRNEPVREGLNAGPREGRANEAADRAKEQTRDAVNQAGDTAEKIGNQTREAAGQAGDTARLTAERARETTERLTDQARAGAERAGDQARAINEQANAAARHVAGQAREMTERATSQAKAAAERAAGQAREIGENVVDSVSKTTDAALDVTQRAADQGREVLLKGVRAAANVQDRLDGRNKELLGSSAKVIEVYRQASESAAGDVQALVSCYLNVGRSMQEIQQKYLDLLSRNLERTAKRRQDLLNCKSPEEFAQVQRDIYAETVNQTIEAASTLLEVGSRAAQEALKPLQNRR
jgi:Phasin protein